MDNVQIKVEASFSGFKQSFTDAKKFMSDVVGGMKQELKSMSDAAKLTVFSHDVLFEAPLVVPVKRPPGVVTNMVATLSHALHGRSGPASASGGALSAGASAAASGVSSRPM